MLPDYFAMTPADDYTITGPFSEMFNSARAYAYAASYALPWITGECEHCPTAHPPATYITPGTGSPAPWWNGTEEAAGFLGIIGLDVEGGDNSTRKANVSESLSGGGTIGAPYYTSRTILFRGLLIAYTNCGLQFGLKWIQFPGADFGDPCQPPSLVFYDCCPTDMGTGPISGCFEGPTHLLTPEPQIGAAEPYRRQFKEARITEGPEIIEVRHTMNSFGAYAIFEMTITCGNPKEYGPDEFGAAVDFVPAGELVGA